MHFPSSTYINNQVAADISYNLVQVHAVLMYSSAVALPSARKHAEAVQKYCDVCDSGWWERGQGCTCSVWHSINERWQEVVCEQRGKEVECVDARMNVCLGG